MVRTTGCDKNGVKKGKWTPEEDKKLIDYITRYGHWNWHLLPKFAGLARSGKSCRLRWLNYLRPGLKRGNFTQEEEEIIIKLNRNLGNRWSMIAAQLPGRTDNEIKNYWNTNLKDRSQQDLKKQSSTEPTTNVFQSFGTTQDSSPFSQHSSSSTTTVTNTQNLIMEKYRTGTSKENLVLEDEYSFWNADTDLMSDENFWLEPYMLYIHYVPSESDEYFSLDFDEELWSHTRQEHDSSPFFQHSPTSSEYATVNDSEIMVPEDYTSVTRKENLAVEDEFAFWDVDSTNLMGEIEPYITDISYINPSELECLSPVFDAELWSHDDHTFFHSTQNSFTSPQHSSSSTSEEYTTVTSNDNLVMEDEFALIMKFICRHRS